MRVHAVALSLLLLATHVTSRPVSTYQHKNELVELEREVFALTDLTMPTLMRLVKMRDQLKPSGLRDLEMTGAGGTAMKDTQWEKDAIQSYWLAALAAKTNDPFRQRFEWALTHNKPRPLDEKLHKQWKAAYTRSAAMKIEDMARFDNILSTLPPLIAIGEGMDQYFEVVKTSCAYEDVTPEARAKEFKAAMDGISHEDLIKALSKRVGGEPQKLEPQLKTMVQGLEYEFVRGDAKEGDKKTSACEYVRSYVEDRGHAMPLSAKAKWGDQKGPMTFENFATVMGLSAEDQKSLAFLVYRLADLSSWFDPEGPKTAPIPKEVSGDGLDQCEFQLATYMLGERVKGSPPTWKHTTFMQPGGANEQFYSYMYKGAMGFHNFERMIKTIDLGNHAINTDGNTYSFGNLMDISDDVNPEELNAPLAKALFDSISKGEGSITYDKLKEFLMGLCDPKPDTVNDEVAKKAQKKVLEALRDYNRDGGDKHTETISFEAFLHAQKGFANLVHGVTRADVQKAVVVVMGEAASMDELSQPQFVGIMSMLMRFGQYLNHGDEELKDGVPGEADIPELGDRLSFDSYVAALLAKDEDKLTSMYAFTEAQVKKPMEDDTQDNTQKERPTNLVMDEAMRKKMQEQKKKETNQVTVSTTTDVGTDDPAKNILIKMGVEVPESDEKVADAMKTGATGFATKLKEALTENGVDIDVDALTTALEEADDVGTIVKAFGDFLGSVATNKDVTSEIVDELKKTKNLDITAVNAAIATAAKTLVPKKQEKKRTTTEDEDRRDSDSNEQQQKRQSEDVVDAASGSLKTATWALAGTSNNPFEFLRTENEALMQVIKAAEAKLEENVGNKLKEAFPDVFSSLSDADFGTDISKELEGKVTDETTLGQVIPDPTKNDRMAGVYDFAKAASGVPHPSVLSCAETAVERKAVAAAKSTKEVVDLFANWYKTKGKDVGAIKQLKPEHLLSGLVFEAAMAEAIIKSSEGWGEVYTSVCDSLQQRPALIADQLVGEKLDVMFLQETADSYFAGEVESKWEPYNVLREEGSKSSAVALLKTQFKEDVEDVTQSLLNDETFATKIKDKAKDGAINTHIKAVIAEHNTMGKMLLISYHDDFELAVDFLNAVRAVKDESVKVVLGLDAGSKVGQEDFLTGLHAAKLQTAFNEGETYDAEFWKDKVTVVKARSWLQAQQQKVVKTSELESSEPVERIERVTRDFVAFDSSELSASVPAAIVDSALSDHKLVKAEVSAGKSTETDQSDPDLTAPSKDDEFGKIKDKAAALLTALGSEVSPTTADEFATEFVAAAAALVQKEAGSLQDQEEAVGELKKGAAELGKAENKLQAAKALLEKIQELLEDSPSDTISKVLPLIDGLAETKYALEEENDDADNADADNADADNAEDNADGGDGNEDDAALDAEEKVDDEDRDLERGEDAEDHELDEY